MQDYEARFAKQSAFWTGPRLIALAAVVLSFAITVIMIAATVVPHMASR